MSSIPCGVYGQFEKCKRIFDDEDMRNHPMGNSGEAHCPLDLLICVPKNLEGMQQCARVCKQVLVINRPLGSFNYCLKEKSIGKEKGPSQPLPPIPNGLPKT